MRVDDLVGRERDVRGDVVPCDLRGGQLAKGGGEGGRGHLGGGDCAEGG